MFYLGAFMILAINSPYCLPYLSYTVSSENLVLTQTKPLRLNFVFSPSFFCLTMCCYFKKKVLDWKGYVKYSWKLIVWDVNFVVFSCFRSSREVKKCKIKRWYNGQYRRHHVKLGMCVWNCFMIVFIAYFYY